MFTKNNNTYLFPSPPLHHHHHHHHPDIFSGHHYNIPALADLHRHHSPVSAFLNNQDDVTGATEKKQPTVKKDRHSKIFTSQGPRDRRVRLSIGIARKFFDLQEMLGFDKPSKTLDWLLTKSKAAIKDLVQTKEKHGDDNDKGSSSPVPSECELGDQCGADSKGKYGNKNKGVAAAPSSSSLAKAESRAKARARARERTREKMCIKEKLKSGGDQINSAELMSPFNYNPNQVGGFHQQELGQESVLIRRKTKNPNPSFFGFQQNVFVSGSGYGGGFGNGGAHENWDVCSFTSILDQHKFMNRSSDM